MTSPPPYRYLRAAYQYKGRLRKAILHFKMNRVASRAAPLASLLLDTQQMGIQWKEYNLVVPVPLHNNRLRWRGYNQCSLLIREIAKSKKLVWSEDALVRTRDTAPQFSLKYNQRSKNVKNAFSCNHPQAIAGKSILLVDDITTTGSTIAECAIVLRNAGASVVDAAVLARPVNDDEAQI